MFIEGKKSSDFYQTERGKMASNDRRSTPATYAKFMNFHPFINIEFISPRPILFVVGDAAPFRTYIDRSSKMAVETKEHMETKGANHINL